MKMIVRLGIGRIEAAPSKGSSQENLVDVANKLVKILCSASHAVCVS